MMAVGSVGDGPLPIVRIDGKAQKQRERRER